MRDYAAGNLAVSVRPDPYAPRLEELSALQGGGGWERKHRRACCGSGNAPHRFEVCAKVSSNPEIIGRIQAGPYQIEVLMNWIPENQECHPGLGAGLERYP